MPIKKRRTQANSPFIYPDPVSGVLVVRTPPSCTSWPIEFRLRIVRDYTPPETDMPDYHFLKYYIESGLQKIVYRVERKPVLVINPYELRLKKARIAGTYVVNLKDKVAALLDHSEPAIRVLVAYDFLSDQSIPGIPSYKTIPFTETDVPT